ncbi:urease accessory protein UreD [Piscinibacter sakaiensis]|uniref:Urease accessory protein UreD n=1 Tax=Piscinibacter sakaiensis TaxID=1547922 RepID=A0A0K8NT77_PISS1|nr:urease accessory protein UreD [Piscinibacter sakaiensis]GAP33568.1 urease accessory protein UreD [Piscinibacter sakaiensis]
MTVAEAGWQARLSLGYDAADGRTRAEDRHEGPLRVLASLYPEGPAICHHVLVHPPGGLVGGDRLDIALRLGPGSHAVLTTPGATRFYRSGGPTARQQVQARLAAGARLEWLPLETICHRAARADNRLSFALEPGAEMIGWDLLALGLPASGEAFDAGQVDQRIELEGAWLERASIDATDRRLLDGPVGWAGHRVLGTGWCGAGSPWPAATREALLEAARAVAVPPDTVAGVTAPDGRALVARVLAPRVEPALAWLAAVRAAWRGRLWGLAPNPPRIWRT